MRISVLVEKLQTFQSKHGDCEVEAEYWCVDCRDTHTGEALELELTSDKKLRLSVVHLGAGDV
jgi:hypothetical protein